MSDAPVLAQELCDTIIDFLWDDHDTLNSVSRTCSSFTFRAQGHLFREVGISHFAYGIVQARRLVDTIKGSPHLIPLVQHLSFRFSNSAVFDLLASSGISWCNVNRLSLAPIEAAGNAGGFATQSLESIKTLVALPSLRRVRLDFKPFPSHFRRDIYAIFSCLNPGVRILELRSLQLRAWPSNPGYQLLAPISREHPLPPHGLPTVPRLDTLRLISTDGDFLCEPACPLDISALHEVEGFGWENSLLFATAVSGTVRKWTFDNLHRLRNEEILHLIPNITEIDFTALSISSLNLERAMDHLTPAHRIAKIGITMFSSSFSIGSPRTFRESWKGCVATMVEKNPSLQELSLKVLLPHYGQRGAVKEEVEAAFPDMCQGILKLTFVEERHYKFTVG
ncbi:hypothetical protein R3P38DRAFT_3215873 [Favolaschia claudopus]|uniref:F-box domain-containing protein n=1 Tax=Favolaschia claudopus TaxID=2862362 RepID=A0AAW0A8G4_9AGAR